MTHLPSLPNYQREKESTHLQKQKVVFVSFTLSVSMKEYPFHMTIVSSANSEGSLHTYIHTHTHTYIHTYIHTCKYIHISFYNTDLMSVSLLLADVDLQLKVLNKIFLSINTSISVKTQYHFLKIHKIIKVHIYRFP